MDIPQLSMDMSMAKVQDAVGIAMLKNSMETMEVTGEGMADMAAAVTENMVNPALGGNIDLSV